MIKNILSIIGALVVAAGVYGYSKLDLGTLISQASKLDPQAAALYTKMANTVLTTGNAAEGMIRRVKVNEDVSNEDIKDTIDSVAGDGNMQVVGDVVMFDGSPLSANGGKTKYTRIFSLCSRPIAQQFLNSSMAYGAFMPCRIMLQEDDNGDRWMYTMDMDLMIHGGQTLTPDMLEMANKVKDTIYAAMDKAAIGDF